METLRKAGKQAKYGDDYSHIIVCDILPDILVRLPLKSLIGCNTLLSKECHALITKDDVFRNLVISRQNRTASGLLISSGYELQPVFDYSPLSSSSIPPLKKLDFGFKRYAMVPHQSCNGLLICSSHWYDQTGIDKYYVCNLTTKKFLHLPEPHGKYSLWSEFTEMRLAFDPVTCPYYTVVAIVRLTRFIHHVYQFFIYSSNNNLWKLSGQPFRRQSAYKCGGVYWNGAIHWISLHHRYASCYFHIKSETLKTMPSVPVTNSQGDDVTNAYYFGESCGHLLYVQTGFKQIDIYEMKSDYSEWFIKHSVDVLKMGDYNYQTVTIHSVVCGEQDDDYILILRVPGQVIRFDIASSTCQKLRDIEDETHIRVFHYTESLCSV